MPKTGTTKRRVTPAPRPNVRAPVHDVSVVVAVSGWRASFDVGIEGGWKLNRAPKKHLELFAKIPGWKPERLVVLLTPADYNPTAEAGAVGLLMGSRKDWTATLTVTNQEFDFLVCMATGGTAMQLTLKCAKPRYRAAQIYRFYTESGSAAEALSPQEDI